MAVHAGEALRGQYIRRLEEATGESHKKKLTISNVEARHVGNGGNLVDLSDTAAVSVVQVEHNILGESVLELSLEFATARLAKVSSRPSSIELG